MAHRGWNVQPGGGSSGLGTSPWSTIRRRSSVDDRGNATETAELHLVHATDSHRRTLRGRLFERLLY
jgi:hypothetical protein